MQSCQFVVWCWAFLPLLLDEGLFISCSKISRRLMVHSIADQKQLPYIHRRSVQICHRTATEAHSCSEVRLIGNDDRGAADRDNIWYHLNSADEMETFSDRKRVAVRWSDSAKRLLNVSSWCFYDKVRYYVHHKWDGYNNRRPGRRQSTCLQKYGSTEVRS